MALTVQRVGRGQILGGLGRIEGPGPVEALDAATRERQTQQAAEQQRRQTALSMQQTRQQMALAQAQEARRAQAFQLDLEDRQRAQAARAAAAARQQQNEAARRRIMKEYGASLPQGGPGLVTGAPGVSAPATTPTTPARPAAPAGINLPLNMGTPVSPETTAGTPLSMGVTPAGPAGINLPLNMGTPVSPETTEGASLAPATAPRAGVLVDTADPRAAFRLAFETEPEMFGVQVADASGVTGTPGAPGAPGAAESQPTRTTYYGVEFDIYPDGRIVNLATNTEIPDTPEYQALRDAVTAMASGDPLQMMQPRGVRPEAGRELPEYVDTPGGALPTGQPTRVEFSGIPFDVYPDGRMVNTVTNTELPVTGEYDALRTTLTAQAGMGAAPQAAVTTPGLTEVDPNAPAFTQDVQGLLRRGDIAGAINRIGDRLATGGYGPMGSPLGAAVGYFTDTPEEAARRTAVAGALDWFRDPANVQFLQENPGLIAEAAVDPISFVARQAATQQTVEVQTTTPSGEETTVTIDEGPTLSFGAGLREPSSESPIDYVLGQPVGSGAAAPNIPREVPRISSAITQGFAERERLAQMYNAYTQAGLLDDAQDTLQAIQNLDETLIRLQGEQAINDLQIGSVAGAPGAAARAAQLLSYYYGADVQPVLNSEGKYDLYVNGQPSENDDFIDLRPDQMGNILRPFFDEQYRDAMAKGRAQYLTARAEQQAERDMAEAENPGFTVERTLTGANGETYMVLTNPAGEFRLVWFELDANNNPVIRTRALTQEYIANMGF